MSHPTFDTYDDYAAEAWPSGNKPSPHPWNDEDYDLRADWADDAQAAYQSWTPHWLDELPDADPANLPFLPYDLPLEYGPPPSGPAQASPPLRSPYVGEGADGARRSAQIDREELDTLAPDDPLRDRLAMSIQSWDVQAAYLDTTGNPGQVGVTAQSGLDPIAAGQPTTAPTPTLTPTPIQNVPLPAPGM